MAFRASSGQILVTDAADARTVFDSNEPLFSASYYQGSKTIPQRQATFNGETFTYTHVDVENDHFIDTVPSGYDTVVGGFKVSTSLAQGIAGLGWFNANGTYMHFADAVSPVTRGDDNNYYLVSIATYTFMISGTNLIIRERVKLQSQGSIASVSTSITLLAITFDYKLFCGKF